MGDFLKNFASLIIAASILLGILFLPPDSFERVKNLLDFLSKGSQTAPAFGNYLIQKVITGVVVLLGTVVLYKAARRAVKGHLEDS